ncbi:MAG: hypothetical protein U9R47_05415 [Actinomycetota bacterium]|nr:hypothetical protein [Actinomycetota bacterium]
MVFARTPLIASLALVAAGCSNATAATTTNAQPTTDPVVSVANQGGSMEGHTPTGFAGMGTGLFVGDNLNPSFPEGQGVQTYLTFALPADLAISSGILISDVLTTTGTPFEDLGPLLAEAVEYPSFGPEVFDLRAAGIPVACRVTGGSTVECDVTVAVQDAIAHGRDTVQFRLRFERPADNDGQPDLAMFFRTDSNTNEAGLFNLLITQDQ